MLGRMAILGLLSLLLVASPASARIIMTIDPDNFAEGTNLTNAVDGVTISHISQNRASSYYDVIYSDVFAQNCGESWRWCAPGAGDLHFGAGHQLYEAAHCLPNAGYAQSLCMDGFSGIEFAFDSPVDFVQAGFGWSIDGPAMLVFDPADNLLAFCYAAFGSSFDNTCSWWMPDSFSHDRASNAFGAFQSDSRNISRVVVGGVIVSEGVHQFSYAVPEPGTVALLGLGLAGLGVARRRKH